MLNRRGLFLLFFVSGFCSLVYQMIWTRLAFAAFGIITPVLSVVLSVFMLGLSLGAWGAGKFIPGWRRRTGLSAIFFYGGAELLIGAGGLAAPWLMRLGQNLLLTIGETSSPRYLVLSALALAAAILPWCICMGATFPLMMAYMREKEEVIADSFSYLYLPNVLGAMVGTILTAYVLVETLGFHHTLLLAAVGNFAIAAASFFIGLGEPKSAGDTVAATAISEPVVSAPKSQTGLRWILFMTGFCSMGMEVVWTRAFTPVLQTQVYSFAAIVFTYLGATFLGSWSYRYLLARRKGPGVGILVVLLGLTAFLPVLAVDPRILPVTMDVSNGTYNDAIAPILFVLASICPFCALLGCLTPGLIDQCAGGNPKIAGKAYGINVLGCILGPLCASYGLLPFMNDRYALVILGVPFLGAIILHGLSLPRWQYIIGLAGGGAGFIWSLFFAHDLEWITKNSDAGTQIRRDYAATVMSFGKGPTRRLLVNGYGMTALVSETKFMVHLPMALHKEPPKSALIICFGMGTSYRAALSWGCNVTVVELVPSVVKAFGYYHADAQHVLDNPKGRIVIDDGRRFLARTREKYDVIVIDPPPPLEAAGSSLLYSQQFLELARDHLNPGGILQIWYPGGPKATAQAIMRSMCNAFPDVKSFAGWRNWGGHFLGSTQPIDDATPVQMAERMPATARKDLVEWVNQGSTAASMFARVIANEFDPRTFLNRDLNYEITDDQPFNEYYLLREHNLYQP